MKAEKNRRKKQKATKGKYVYVISKVGKPLMPTCRYGKVRWLLRKGKAKIVSYLPFTIQLEYETSEYRQGLILSIDTGSKTIGAIVRKADGQVVFAGELKTRSREVTEKLSERRMHRRARRRHRRIRRLRRYCASRKRAGDHSDEVMREYKIAGTEEVLRCREMKPKLVRFNNRKRGEGWLTPTARHLLESHKNYGRKIGKILPISKVRVEYGKFDIHKLGNPKVKGRQYQEGRKKGYANAREYVLQRDKYSCQYCKKGERELHAHHVIWQRDNGADVPENLVILCRKCHERVHKNKEINAQVVKLFNKMTKRFAHTTLLNSIMPRFYQWLTEQFPIVQKVYGYEVKEMRRKWQLAKAHWLDAYVGSWIGFDDVKMKMNEVLVYRMEQFRRHNRKLIHARRDRNYYEGDGKKIIAKNRHKRCGQKANSLVEYLARKKTNNVSHLRVKPGKKMIRHKATREKKSCYGITEYRQGDVVLQNTSIAVVRGSNQKGYSLMLWGQKNYVVAKKCKLLLKNTGVVCVTTTLVSKSDWSV